MASSYFTSDDAWGTRGEQTCAQTGQESSTELHCLRAFPWCFEAGSTMYMQVCIYPPWSSFDPAYVCADSKLQAKPRSVTSHLWYVSEDFSLCSKRKSLMRMWWSNSISSRFYGSKKKSPYWLISTRIMGRIRTIRKCRNPTFNCCSDLVKELPRGFIR